MATFSGIRFKRTVPKDWYENFNTMDPYEAWFILHFQIQVQLFRHHFFVLRDLKWSPFFVPWSVLIPHPESRFVRHKDEKHFVAPVGHIARLIRHCKNSLKERGKVSWLSELRPDPYETLIQESRRGWTKEIHVMMDGLRHVTTPILAPNEEAELIPGLMGQLRGTPGKDPSEFFVVHNAFVAEKLNFRIKIGPETKEFAFPNQLIAFQFSKYHYSLSTRFPVALVTPPTFNVQFTSPFDVHWPADLERKEEEERKEGGADPISVLSGTGPASETCL